MKNNGLRLSTPPRALCLKRRRCALLLYDLQSPVNIGQVLRTGEQFQIRILMYDPKNVLADSESRRIISDFSCGALERRPPQMIDEYAAFRTLHWGRKVATCLRPDATRLKDFYFQQEDIVILGNEYDGLPASVINSADALLYIPLPKADLPKPPSFSPIDPSRGVSVAQNGVPNLNVAAVASIIGYTSRLQSDVAPPAAAANPIH